MEITYWLQKPNFKYPFGKHRWQEMEGLQRKAITFFAVCFGMTIYKGGYREVY